MLNSKTIQNNSAFSIQHSALRRGQAVMTLVIFTMLASLGGLLGFSYVALRETGSSRETKRAEQSFYLSEAGVEDATHRIIEGMQYGSAETLALDGFSVTTAVLDAGADKEVTGEGNVQDAVRSGRVILETGGGASFRYGVQVGDDGIVFDNNAKITGSVYSNGNITGDQGAEITGDAIVARGTAAIADQSFGVRDGEFAVGKGETGSIIADIDTGGDVGKYNAVALGADGFARIGYYDATNKDLKFARCANADCTEKNIATVDFDGDVGFRYAGIAVGADGFARIGYYNNTNGDLKFARCANADCTEKNIATVDSSGDVGQFSALALGSDGFARMSYFSVSGGNLKFVRCADADCAAKNIATVDSSGDVGKYTSLALGADGFARIAYRHESDKDLKFARCTDADCASANVTTVDAVGDLAEFKTGTGLGADGFARISYYDKTNGNLKLARCANADCASVILTVVDSAGDVGKYSSIRMASDDFPRISYYDATNGAVKFALCLNADCVPNSIASPDGADDTGHYTSLALSGGDFGRIGYYNNTKGDLKFIQCANIACSALNIQNDAAQSFKPSRSDTLNFVSVSLKKVGSPAALSIKVMRDEGGRPGDSAGDILARGEIQAGQVSDSVFTFLDVGLSQTPVLDPAQTYWIMADASRDDNNYYLWGLDSAAGYGNGSAKWSQDWTGGAWNAIAGDLNFQVWMGGKNNFIDDVIVGGFAKANTIRSSTVAGNVTAVTAKSSTMRGNVVANSLSDCTVDGNASYNIISNCPVGGSTTTPVTVPPEEPPLVYPISDAQILAWKNEAEAGGAIAAGDYNPPDDATTIIGPGTIGGNLILNNRETVILAGTVWVKGNIDVANSAVIKLAASFGSLSGILLADGWAHFQNNGQFAGSGTPGSYLVIAALIECRGKGESGCTHHDAAIDLHNNATGAIFYAPNGLAYLHNNIRVTEITARGLAISQNSEVVYEQGIANLKFSAGPSGGYNIKRWKEVE